jgi:hypothetical protein
MMLTRQQLADLETAMAYMDELGRSCTLVNNRVLRALIQGYQHHDRGRERGAASAPQTSQSARRGGRRDG